MNTLTLKIPDTLDTALQLASARRHMSKSAVVREALEQLLAEELKQTTPAAHWLGQWRGAFTGKVLGKTDDAIGDSRLAHILSKHLR